MASGEMAVSEQEKCDGHSHDQQGQQGLGEPGTVGVPGTQRELLDSAWVSASKTSLLQS